MIELYQAEWCPHSHKVRQRMTELGLDFVARQVAADKEDRPDELEIPTLDGHATIKIPTETQTGQVFRLKNKGIRPVRGSVTGDLYCHVVIETPVKLTARQKELLREFEAINDQDPGAHSPRAKSFFDKVRDFFGQ